MATESLAREAALTAVDTEVTAKTIGTTTAENFIVPKGKPWITTITGLYCSDGAAAGSSVGVLILWDGTQFRQEIPLGAFGAELTTTHSTIAQAVEIPVNIKCTPGEEIKARFAMYGEDTGTSQAFAELVFSSSPRSGMGSMQYTALEVQNTAVDTWVQLQGLGTASAETYLATGTKISQILCASAADGQAVGAGTISARFTGNGLQTEQQLILSGSGGTHTAEANGHSPVLVKERNIAIESGNRIKGEVNMVGVDIGSTSTVIALGFSR